jgi:integrase/recombinase XerC
MHLRQRQRRTKEDEDSHPAAPRLEVLDTVGRSLTTSFRAGTDLVLVAELMGHHDLETTRLYTLPTEADVEAAVARLPTDQ